LLVDLGCGGGLMGPYAARLGYRHVGIDLGVPGLALARAHGVLPVRASVLAVPLVDGCADVVVAGEILEHVEDDVAVLAEAARLLRPGGALVLDSLAATWLADLIAVRLLERVPAGPPRGIHDPRLFVDRRRLLAAADRLGLDLRLVGLRPSVRDMLAWRRGRRRAVRMKRVPVTAVLFAGYGRKRHDRPAAGADSPREVAEGHSGGMTSGGTSEPQETSEVEQRLAQTLDPERHAKPSEGVPQDLPEDDSGGGEA
jgi:2-polyprenyl-6-hydroxyphenyl methylase/3-demethylubiquinone-9 3-methyltransferase